MEDKAKKAMLEEELGVLKQAENDASSKLTLAQEELQILMADEQKEKKRVYDLSTQLNDAKELLEKKSTEYADIKAALPKSQDALRLAREQVPLIKEEEDKLADDVNNTLISFIVV
uniref:MT domain-containing protein n=1 Tax=Heterorhabditis bacteriophora TaxID=37862 RepID=A0A1I7X6R3_HETBA